MCARHYFEYFTCINSFNPPNNPMDMVAATYSQILQKENNRVGKKVENDKTNGKNITMDNLNKE